MGWEWLNSSWDVAFHRSRSVKNLNRSGNDHGHGILANRNSSFLVHARSICLSLTFKPFDNSSTVQHSTNFRTPPVFSRSPLVTVFSLIKSWENRQSWQTDIHSPWRLSLPGKLLSPLIHYETRLLVYHWSALSISIANLSQWEVGTDRLVLEKIMTIPNTSTASQLSEVGKLTMLLQNMP